MVRFVPRHADELQLEADDPVLLLSQAEDLWCQGYNMRTGATGIFPAFYVVKLAADTGAGTGTGTGTESNESSLLVNQHKQEPSQRFCLQAQKYYSKNKWKELLRELFHSQFFSISSQLLQVDIWNSSWSASWVQFRFPVTKGVMFCVQPCTRYGRSRAHHSPRALSQKL